MKELSMEEKAIAYDEKVSQAKEMLKDDTISQNAINYIQHLFPELKGSEDEKWRSWLIGHLQGYKNTTTPQYSEACDKAIAWLEKQGEQNSKSAQNGCRTSDTEEEVNKSDDYKKGFECGKQRVLKYPEDFGLRNPAEWSEEDENWLINAINVCKLNHYNETADWLKSLKDKYTWKPSDEQMEILQYLCATSSHPNKKVIPTLELLLSDLKKLRYENTD